MADDLIQKFKGKAQQVKGDIKMESPRVEDKVSGAVDKLKGKVNETLSVDNSHSKNNR